MGPSSCPAVVCCCADSAGAQSRVPINANVITGFIPMIVPANGLTFCGFYKEATGRLPAFKGGFDLQFGGGAVA